MIDLRDGAYSSAKLSGKGKFNSYGTDFPNCCCSCDPLCGEFCPPCVCAAVRGISLAFDMLCDICSMIAFAFKLLLFEGAEPLAKGASSPKYLLLSPASKDPSCAVTYVVE